MKINNILLLLFLTITGVGVQAQQKYSQENPMTIERIQSKSGWLKSTNPAGLEFNQGILSQAKAFYKYDGGSYRNVYTAAHSNSFGINTESYRRLGKVSLYGMLGYERNLYSSKSWTGMTFPGTTPMLIADSIPSYQVMENYKVTGGLSYPVSEHFVIGAKLEYMAADNAKQKDLRNRNRYMDVAFTPGIVYKSNWVNAGINLTYARRSERVAYSMYGDQDAHKVYFFTGMWFCERVPFNVMQSNPRMFIDDMYEGAAQVEFVFNDRFKFFNQFKGNYREQQQANENGNQKYGNFERLTYDYMGSFNYTGDQLDHVLTIGLSFNDLSKYDDVYEDVIDPVTGNVTPTYREKIERYTESVKNITGEYQLFVKRNEWNSSWMFKAGFNYYATDNKYTIFPKEFKQNIHVTNFYLGANKNIELNKGSLDVNLDLGYTTGGGDKMIANNTEGVNVSGGILYYREDLLTQQFNYLTSDRLDGRFGVRYTHFLKKKGSTSVFVDANVRYIDVTKGPIKNQERTLVQATLGVNF